MINYVINMNWTFNQNCQLIIDNILDKGDRLHSIEVIIYPNGGYNIYIDRNEKIILDLPEDGLYLYKYLLTDTDPSTIDITTIPDANTSVGGWTGQEEIFSICHLRKCAIAHEKQAIEEFLSTCHKKNCNQKSSMQSTRDILLISIFVLEHLICQNKYNEAQRILNQLGSCSNLCPNTITKTCDCNG